MHVLNTSVDFHRATRSFLSRLHFISFDQSYVSESLFLGCDSHASSEINPLLMVKANIKIRFTGVQ